MGDCFVNPGQRFTNWPVNNKVSDHMKFISIFQQNYLKNIYTFLICMYAFEQFYIHRKREFAQICFFTVFWLRRP